MAYPDADELLAEIDRQVNYDHFDSNVQHLRYLLYGYRCAVAHDGRNCPYSPGSARATSWNQGFDMALRDKAAREKVTT